MNRKKKTFHSSRIIIPSLLLIIVFFMVRVSYNAEISYPEATVIKIEKGNTIAKFYQHLGTFQKFMMKLWLKNNKNLIPNIQEGSYTLSGNYGKGDFLVKIAQGPEQDYLRLTLLEGWSIYDIDKSLSDKGLITAGDFIAKSKDQSFIDSLKSDFSFLSILPYGKSLEGFLYPDTYFLDKNAPILDQLIKAQLKNFNQKIWIPLSDNLNNFKSPVSLSSYELLTLASIIENEEKLANNKPTIAGIFLNRLEKGMRLDADVSLCYGLKITYDECRPKIEPNLSDASNLYNTRQNFGLTPTPISSPSYETLSALLNFNKTKALFYLHDNKGVIHYADTIEQHNENKVKYLPKK